MKIIDLFKTKKPVISFEVFPPRLDTPVESIFSTLLDLKDLDPDFISVTYGAGGTKKGKTCEIASRIINEHKLDSLAHFTCVGHSKDEIDLLLDQMRESGIENILTLRGDPPKDQPGFDFSRNIFSYASELIDYIKSKTSDTFCIAAAAYVEGHINSSRIKDDIRNLKHKVDMGVDFLVTQLFYDNRNFYDFMDKIITIGIKCPVSAGIMPVFKADQIKNISVLCGASIPAKLILLMDKYQDSPENMCKAGIEYACQQAQDLIDNQVDGVHLMTMNKGSASREIMKNLKF